MPNQLQHSMEAFALNCVMMGFEETEFAHASSWLDFLCTMLCDTCRLTLTDWLRLRETTKDCGPVNVDVSDGNCLPMHLCCDKTVDAYQIGGAFLSIKVFGFRFLKACQRSSFHQTSFKRCWFFRISFLMETQYKLTVTIKFTTL